MGNRQKNDAEKDWQTERDPLPPVLMGHKVNPIGLRLGINRTWDSRWFAGDDYARLLHEDFKLREKR